MPVSVAMEMRVFAGVACRKHGGITPASPATGPTLVMCAEHFGFRRLITQPQFRRNKRRVDECTTAIHEHAYPSGCVVEARVGKQAGSPRDVTSFSDPSNVPDPVLGRARAQPPVLDFASLVGLGKEDGTAKGAGPVSPALPSHNLPCGILLPTAGVLASAMMLSAPVPMINLQRSGTLSVPYGIDSISVQSVAHEFMRMVQLEDDAGPVKA